VKREQLALAILGAALSLRCQPEQHVTPHKPVTAPVDNVGAIPDAQLAGTLRGVKFVVKDARYTLDHRMGFHRADIRLSAGAAETPCGPIKPDGSPSVWLRLEGSDAIATQDLALTPGAPPGERAPWSVHYQLRENDAWTGSGDAAVVGTLRASAGDGIVSGALAVCFADDRGSCVSGSFEALPCPYTIDAPVRGAQPAEAVPEKYKPKLKAP
jgi:hypothetical protein